MDYFVSAQASSHADAFPDLTEREREVLIFIARGRSNVEIATELSISLKTVRNHASNIFYKLQVADRTQAAIRARCRSRLTYSEPDFDPARKTA
jgi:DNA-binding NarL/FixJ family response regulator